MLQPAAVPASGPAASAIANGTVSAALQQPWDIPSNRPLGPSDSLASVEKGGAKVMSPLTCCLWLGMHSLAFQAMLTVQAAEGYILV